MLTTQYKLFAGNQFGFGGASAATSPSNDNGSAQNTDPALASTYIYTKFIESEGKGANFTGIALGSGNPYIVGLDESSEGQISTCGRWCGSCNSNSTRFNSR